MFSAYSKTDIGKVRETNQDSCAWGRLEDDCLWAVVCDGMGGANGGNIASSMTIEIVSHILSKKFDSRMNGEQIRDVMDEAIFEANKALLDHANTKPELYGMGTTIVMAVINRKNAYLAYVGDSRIYSVGNDGITQLSVDHSMVQLLVDLGEITAEEAKHHPKKNIITRAVGVSDTIDVDFIEYSLVDGDKLLLCTDGLTNFVEDEDLKRIVDENEGQTAVELLVDNANANGGGDNITVVLITTDMTEDEIEVNNDDSEESEETDTDGKAE